jgi:DNA-binding NarL/FixJ family response regulator
MKIHVANIVSKLGVTVRTEAIFPVRLGISDIEGLPASS